MPIEHHGELTVAERVGEVVRANLHEEAVHERHRPREERRRVPAAVLAQRVEEGEHPAEHRERCASADAGDPEQLPERVALRFGGETVELVRVLAHDEMGEERHFRAGRGQNESGGALASGPSVGLSTAALRAEASTDRHEPVADYSPGATSRAARPRE